MSPDNTLFNVPPPQKAWTDQEWGLAVANTQRLFNPSSPVDEEKLFSGRTEQVNDLLGVIYERGAHAVLYGERGTGKSSLANTITAKIPPAVTNIKFRKENCRPEDTFFTLWAKMLWDYQYEGVAVSEFLKNEDRHFVVTKILETLEKGKQHVFIFDEFDRLATIETKNAMADTIKHFSDYPQNITIVIIGVGFSIQELFGAHPSIQRCCRQILMPRMPEMELSEIIFERYEVIGISLASGINETLIDLAQGFPGYAHLVGREAALSAIRRKSRVVEKFDHDIAVKESVRRAQESIVSSYNTATYSPRDNLYKEVLLACALADRNDRGQFSASAVRDKLARITGRSTEISYFARHLAAFCSVERGPVLRKTGKPKGFQYQFIDAPLQPYITMVGRNDCLI
jgi:Cdc6-like AAA superfamily ATPase